MTQELGDLIGGGMCLSHYHAKEELQHEDAVAMQKNHVQRTSSVDTSLSSSDDVLLMTTTGGNRTVTLPLSGGGGKEFTVFKVSAANALTVQCSGADTVNGVSSLVLSTPYSSLWLKDTILGWVAR